MISRNENKIKEGLIEEIVDYLKNLEFEEVLEWNHKIVPDNIRRPDNPPKIGHSFSELINRVNSINKED